MRKLLILIFFILLASFAEAALTDGLVSYYDMNLSSLDTSGNNLNMSLFGNVANFTRGKLGEAYQYDGTNSVSVSADSALVGVGTGDFTITLWINSTQTAPQYMAAVWLGDNGDYFHIYTGHDSCTGVGVYDDNCLWIGDDTETIECNVAASPNYITIKDGLWHYIVVTRTSGTIDCYIDNTDVGTGAVAGALGAGFVSYGAQKTAGWSNWFAGLIDEAAFYNRSLSGAEIAELYNSGAGHSPFSPPPPIVLTLGALDFYDNTTINNFTAYLSNETGTFSYSTTNGTIKPLVSLSEFFNITIDADDYFNISYLNYNSSNTNFVAYPYQAVLNVYANDITDNSISSFTIETGSKINITAGSYSTFFLKSGSYTLNFSKVGYYNTTASFTIGSEETNSTTIENIFTSILNISAQTPGGLPITTFTISLTSLNYSYVANSSTTNGSVEFPLVNGSYYLVIDAPGYAIYNHTINLGTGFHSYNFTIYTTNSIAFYFKDIETNLLVGNVTLDLISTLAAYNYSTPNGTIYIDLIIPENYTIRYMAAGYRESFYYFSLQNRTFNNLTLYLVQNLSSTIVTANVYDEISRDVEGAIIQVLLYDIDTNSYILQEEAITNFDGEARLNLMLNTEYYKFIISYLGDVKKITEPTYIYTNSIAFQINVGGEVGAAYSSYLGIDYSLVFNKATRNFRFTYSDSNSAITQACLKIYRMTASTETLVNNSCLSTTAGVILLEPTNITGATYKAVAYIYLPDEYLLSSLYHTYNGSDIIGKIGLFGVILLTIVFFCVGLWRPVLIGILTPLPTLIGSIIGIINLPVSVALPIQICGLIIAWLISDRG